MPELDQQKSEAFAGRLLEVMNHAGLALMLSIGHRTGLLDAMSKLPPATVDEIAKASSLNPRYVREWLGSLVTGKVVDFDPATGKYTLPAEHAAWLTRAAAPNNMACSTQWVSVLGQVEDRVVDAFTHGRGVPYSAYPRFHVVMAEESSQTVVGGLLEHILPIVPGLIDRLKAGIEVLDIGCGSGRAMSYLAAQFPNSRFHGYDFSDEGITAANAEARAQNLSNVSFEVRDVADFDEPARFDLITAFDAIHDQAKPDRVLANIARAIKPDGVYLMQDIMSSGYVEHDHGLPLATFGYAISCMHCMSVSLSNGGPGLGAMWGKELALAMLAEAGFTSVRVETLPHDILNYYYVCKV